MWMACATQEEIAEAVGLSRPQITEHIGSLVGKGQLSETDQTFADLLDARLALLSVTNRERAKTLAMFAETDEEGKLQFVAPLYNVWSYGAKTNKAKHFGNSEQRILENLLYRFTQPFDIVVDPFAGGGSTIDVCRYRWRRYWVADRVPTAKRPVDGVLDAGGDRGGGGADRGWRQKELRKFPEKRTTVRNSGNFHRPPRGASPTAR